MMENKELASKAATNELWRRGVLSWKLDKVQKELYDAFYNSNHKIFTWLLSRRQGKTYTLCVLALEQCIRKSNSIIKFVAPTQKQIKTVVRPIFRQILQDCPEDICPEFRPSDNIYYFPSGAEIQLAGSDNGHAENLRGTDSDLFFIDEAGTCSDLDNIIKSILLPTTLITKGRGILASTPPKESEHEFLAYIEDAQSKGTLIKKTIDDNPRITQQQKEDLINELGGIKSDETRRELFCEIIKDGNTCVIPEFDEALQKKVIKEWPRPPYFDAYEAMDTGGKDFTVILYGYYDFRAAKLVVEDETVMDLNTKDSNSKLIAEEIHKKEVDLWTNIISGEYKKPYKRVSDINYLFLNEIANQSRLLHGHKMEQIISFDITKKDNVEAAIQNTRVRLAGQQIIIHPRCKTLISHLDNGKWTKNKTDLARSKVDGSHYDALMALVYMVRNVDWKKNPYPTGYELNTVGLFVRDRESFEQKHSTSNIENLKAIFGIKPRKKF